MGRLFCAREQIAVNTEINDSQCCHTVTLVRRPDIYLLIAETRFRSQSVHCGIFRRQNGTGIYIYIYILL